MAGFDFDGLTRRQQEVLGEIAIGFDGGHHPRVLKALLDKGLIETCEQNIYGISRTPIDRLAVKVTHYELPLPVHYAWAQWCSTKVKDKV